MSGPSLNNATFAIGESPWLVRDENDHVITHIDFSNVEPASVSEINLTFEYRGLVPIKILGFYITDIDPTIYSGTQSSTLDAREIIRWGDDYTSELTAEGVPGLSVSYKDFDSEEDVLVAFKSGSGDVMSSPIPYTGHANGILDIDERIKVTFFLVTPSAINREITRASVYSFGVDIAFIEIPERLQDLLVSNEI